MKKIRISGKAILKDIRAKMSDEALMDKYGLSGDNLLRVKRTLLANKLITQEEFEDQGAAAAPTNKTVVAKEFLADFRKKPDDFYLMLKYSLKPKHLKQLYDALLEKGWLSEFEFLSRERKAPELEKSQNLPISASTVVSLVERTVDEFTTMTDRFIDEDLPRDFYRDRTGVQLGRGPSFRTDAEWERITGKKSRRLTSPSTVVEVIPKREYCPKCGHPKDLQEPETCARCGVIFSKLK